MANFIVFSISPHWTNQILMRTKTYELRRRGPPRTAIGERALVYCTAPVSAIVAMFRIGEIVSASPTSLWKSIGKFSGCDSKEFFDYVQGCRSATAISILELGKLRKPLPLSEIRQFSYAPPRSWCRIEIPEDQQHRLNT